MIPIISTIIPWCDRSEVEQTLEKNSSIFIECKAEVILVDCAGTQPIRLNHKKQADDFNLKIVRVPAPRFNKSLAINIGVALARAPIVFVLDADILLDSSLHDCINACKPGYFITIEAVQESHGSTTVSDSWIQSLEHSISLIDRDGKRANVITSRVHPHTQERNAPGLLIANRQDILDINGFNSDLVGWGWEDIDACLRLQLKLGLSGHLMGRAVHLTHSREQSCVNGISSEIVNKQTCLHNYSNRIYDGTLKQDVQHWWNAIF
jgi:glycosyltransferase involved in cell wall biosynthesis